VLTQQALQPPLDTPVPTAPLIVPESVLATPTPTVLAVAPPPILTPPVDAVPTGNIGPAQPLGVLDLIATTLAVTSTTLGWIWFLAGSIIFFAVAGMFAGLSFRQQERRRYAMVDEEAPLWDDLDEGADEPFASWPAAPTANRRAQTVSTPAAATNPEADDGWPASLP
jgi:hypothetical protein